MVDDYAPAIGPLLELSRVHYTINSTISGICWLGCHDLVLYVIGLLSGLAAGLRVS